jgi:hypothetical protein
LRLPRFYFWFAVSACYRGYSPRGATCPTRFQDQRNKRAAHAAHHGGLAQQGPNIQRLPTASRSASPTTNSRAAGRTSRGRRLWSERISSEEALELLAATALHLQEAIAAVEALGDGWGRQRGAAIALHSYAEPPRDPPRGRPSIARWRACSAVTLAAIMRQAPDDASGLVVDQSQHATECTSLTYVKSGATRCRPGTV